LTCTDAILYFLSGTGNTYRLATWMAEAAQNEGVLGILTPTLRVAHISPEMSIKDKSCQNCRLVV